MSSWPWGQLGPPGRLHISWATTRRSLQRGQEAVRRGRGKARDPGQGEVEVEVKQEPGAGGRGCQGELNGGQQGAYSGMLLYAEGPVERKAEDGGAGRGTPDLQQKEA